MTTTKFQVKLIEQYLVELFGNPRVEEPLLRKNLSQKVKFQLKKLGTALEAEHKAAVAQLKEIFEKYSHEVEVPEKEVQKSEEAELKPKLPVSKKRELKEEFKEQFEKEAKEVEDMEVEVSHYEFSERDFIDQSTGEIVAGNIYFNILDKIFFEKEEEPKTT